MTSRTSRRCDELGVCQGGPRQPGCTCVGAASAAKSAPQVLPVTWLCCRDCHTWLPATPEHWSPRALRGLLGRARCRECTPVKPDRASPRQIERKRLTHAAVRQSSTVHPSDAIAPLISGWGGARFVSPTSPT